MKVEPVSPIYPINNFGWKYKLKKRWNKSRRKVVKKRSTTKKLDVRI